MKRKSVLPLLAIVLILQACAYTPPPPHGPSRHHASPKAEQAALAKEARHLPKMRAHFINVGQGSALLLEFPCAAALFDTGGEINKEFNSNARLKKYLTRFYADRPDLKHEIKLLVVTHPHADHVAGIFPVLLAKGAPYHIRNVVTNGQDNEQESGGVAMARLHRWAESRADVKLRKVRAEDIPRGYGLTGPIIDPIQCPQVDPKLRVLWSSPKKKPEDWSLRHFHNQNEHSVVVRVDFGKASFLLLADLETEGIQSMAALAYPSKLLDVDVLQVGHHGSYNGTSKLLMQRTTPKMAVIQCGDHDRQLDWTAWMYGHPRLSAVQLLMDGVTGHRKVATAWVATRVRTFHKIDMDKAIYSTSWDGNVVIEAATNGYLHRVKSE